MLFAQPIPIDSMYFGQTPPGITPKIFAPGIISLPGRMEVGLTHSPDSSEYFFTVTTTGWATAKVMYTKYRNNSWTTASAAVFTDEYELGPMFTPDGNRLLVASGKGGNGNITVSNKTVNGWSALTKLPAPINSTSDEWEATTTYDSTMYFSSNRNSNQGIYYSEIENGSYATAKRLPSCINQFNTTHDVPFVAADGSYIIFGRGSEAARNLYISYKREYGWTNAQNLGSRVNTNVNEVYPFVSWDGKYLFFTRWINNTTDIYWVYIKDLIDSLKQANFSPYVLNQISNQTDTIGRAYSFTLPDSIFFDDDGNKTLTYTATLGDGKPLPTWLSFNAETKTLSGTATDAGSLRIKLIATDTAYTSASTIFTLEIVDNPTSVINPTCDGNIHIYPNPTKDLINISLGSIQYKTALISITDISGKLITLETYHNLSTVTIDLTGNPKGIYLIDISIDGQKQNKKICIE
jgi:hypothetical protein